MKVFEATKVFPREEKYSLTNQTKRSSRSIAGNIAEGWGKRNYTNSFKRHLVNANGLWEESKSWLLFAKDCQYITHLVYEELFGSAEVIGKKLWRLHNSWRDFGTS